MKTLSALFVCLFLAVPVLSHAQQALAPENGKSPSYCESLLATHGLLTRAQFQCGFNRYSNQLINAARTCYKELGEERAMEIIKFGMLEFDRNEGELGRKKLCSSLLQDFPQYVAMVPEGADESQETGADHAAASKVDAKLLRDLDRTDYLEVAREWSKLYDKLDAKYKNAVHTSDSVWAMDHGDLYGLAKGFTWRLCGKYADSGLADTITREFGALGGHSKAEEMAGYRAGMVYFYVKYQLLGCD